MQMKRTKLAEARLKRHWSQAEAAEAVGVDYLTLYRWEAGKSTPRGYNLRSLCEVYGLTVAELGFDIEVSQEQSEKNPSEVLNTEHQAAASSDVEPGDLSADKYNMKQGATQRIDGEYAVTSSVPISVVVSRRQLLQELLAVASFALVTPPYELLSADALDHLAFVLHKPASLDARVLTDLDSITYGIWRARVHGVSSPDLLNGALGHLQVVIQLLKSPHDMRTRRHLYSVARNAGQLVGHLLFDIQDFAMAWSYYNFALSAAQGAHQPDEEAAVLGLMSFVLTYKSHPTETPPETVTLLEQAQLLTAQSTIYPLRACLAAIKAEIHANLGQIDAYHREIDLAQNFLTYPGDLHDTVPDDIFNFDPATLAGYQGACLLRIGKPLEALAALQESVQDLQMIHALRLADIGIAHAQLGAYSKASMLGREALSMIAQTKNRSQLQRVRELRRDLESWKHTSEVQELDHLFKVTATLLEEKQ